MCLRNRLIVEAGADQVLLVTGLYDAHILSGAICEDGYRCAILLSFISAGIAGDAADPVAACPGCDGDIGRFAVGEFFRTETAAGNTTESVAVRTCGDTAGCRAVDKRSQLQAAADNACVGRPVGNRDLCIRAAVDNPAGHTGADDAAVHPLCTHLTGIGGHFAVHQMNVMDCGSERIADCIGDHDGSLRRSIFQCEIADLGVGDAAEETDRDAVFTGNGEVADRVALSVERAGEGCIRRRDLLLLFALTGGLIRTDRVPGDPRKVDIRIENIICGEIICHSRKLFRCGDGDCLFLFGPGNDTQTEHHRYNTDNCQYFFHRYLL